MPLQQAMAPLFQIYKALSDKGSNLQWLPGLRRQWLHYLGALGLKGLHPEGATKTQQIGAPLLVSYTASAD